MYTFTFKTREEYITQTKEWSKMYSQQIANIREGKFLYKQAQRNGDSIWAAQRLINEGNKNLSKLRTVRAESRVVAQRQFLERIQASCRSRRAILQATDV